MFLFDNASRVESMKCIVDVKKTPIIQKMPVKVVGQRVCIRRCVVALLRSLCPICMGRSSVFLEIYVGTCYLQIHVFSLCSLMSQGAGFRDCFRFERGTCLFIAPGATDLVDTA